MKPWSTLKGSKSGIADAEWKPICIGSGAVTITLLLGDVHTVAQKVAVNFRIIYLVRVVVGSWLKVYLSQPRLEMRRDTMQLTLHWFGSYG
jgi:hypothetical protein